MKIYTAIVSGASEFNSGILLCETFESEEAAKSYLKRIFTLNHRGDESLFEKAEIKKNFWRLACEWPKKFLDGENSIETLEKLQSEFENTVILNTKYYIFESILKKE